MTTPHKTSAVNMRPEAELLLCCARTHMDAERAARIKALLGEGIDWDDVLRIARPQGMAPLLYWNLHATCPEAVPQATLDQLRGHFHANARRNLLLTRELLKLLNLLEGHGIPAIPLKGPVLAASIYGNLAFRQFGDLDILVRQRDVLRARDLIISQGYRSRIQLASAQEEAYLKSHREYQLERDDGEVLVELQWRLTAHWQILSSFPPDPERLWERLEAVPLAGTMVLSLCPEDLLLILCVHGCNHGWRRLSWICDVAELIRVHPSLGYGRVMAWASALGGERMLLLGLFLANDLLGTALPVEAAHRVQADSVVELLALQVREWLFGDQDCPSHLFEEAAFYVRLRECLRDRVPYFLFYSWAYLRPGVVPTAEDRALLPLPTFLSFLYYLLRPMRMVGKYGLSPLKRLLQHLPKHLLAS